MVNCPPRGSATDGGPGPLTPMAAKQARFETSGEIAKFYEIAPNRMMRCTFMGKTFKMQISQSRAHDLLLE